MPIEVVTNTIQQALKRKYEIIRRVIINNLIYVAEKCIIEARDNGSYGDVTGNLRGSIGYVILDNGMTVHRGGFDSSKGSEGGETGHSTGISLAEELAAKFNDGIVLIVVAGMNYAAYVEAKGLNVLASAKLLAEREIPRMMKELKLAA